MNRINARKLESSKWTAVRPRDKEKHFLVTAVHCDAAGVPRTCVLEAVYSGRETELDWRELRNADKWLTGWR